MRGGAEFFEGAGFGPQASSLTHVLWNQPRNMLLKTETVFSIALCTLCLSVHFSLFPAPPLFCTLPVLCSLPQSSFRGVYKCLWPGCGKVLTSSVGIKRHIRVLHLGWVGFTCTTSCLLGMDIAWDVLILVLIQYLSRGTDTVMIKKSDNLGTVRKLFQWGGGWTFCFTFFLNKLPRVIHIFPLNPAHTWIRRKQVPVLPIS